MDWPLQILKGITIQDMGILNLVVSQNFVVTWILECFFTKQIEVHLSSYLLNRNQEVVSQLHPFLLVSAHCDRSMHNGVYVLITLRAVLTT